MSVVDAAMGFYLAVSLGVFVIVSAVAALVFALIGKDKVSKRILNWFM